jgi:hypothetical protein
MKEKLFLTGMLVLALTLGVLVAGCDNGGDSEGDNSGYETGDLPASTGSNAVGGKIYIESSGLKTEFSAVTDGESSSTYKALMYTSGGTYQDIKSGTYSWNETAKRITLKPEKVAALQYGGGYGALEYKVDYKDSMQTWLNYTIEERGEEIFNQQLSGLGFPSAAAYLDYDVAEAFDNKTYNYDFSTDGLALFLDEVIPANEGSDELSGQTYNGMRWYIDDDYPTKDMGQVYTFITYGYTYGSYTYTDTEYPEDNSSGIYAYDSVSKRVWLKPYTTNRQTQYDALVGSSSYSSESAAAKINVRYKVLQRSYNTTDKTIR